MRGSLKIATIAGIPVFVHWSFLALLPLGHYYSQSLGLGWEESVWWALLGLAVFFCILLHEFGHAFAARRFGIRTRDIVLFPVGGMARLDRLPEKPVQEMLVALAGPMVNLLVAATLFPLFWVWTRPHLTTRDLPSADNIDDSYFYFLPLLLFLNLLLAAFNLIPAFPMDGGRVVRALFAIRMGRLGATKVALVLGLAFAVGLSVFGISDGRYSYIFIGAFIAYTAIREYGWVKTEHLLSTKTVAEVYRKDHVVLVPTDTLAKTFDIFEKTGQQGFLVVDETGNTIGTLDVAYMKEINAPSVADVNDFQKIGFVEISPATTLKVANEKMRQEKQTVLAVMEGNTLVGVLEEEKIWEALENSEPVRNDKG